MDDVRGKHARTPRYMEILETLRGEIATGRHPVGSFLPSEAELCREFAVSRFTVREALRRLQEDGMVGRVQGAGSRVLRDAPAGVFVQSYRSVSELTQYARDAPFELHKLEEVALLAGLAPRIGGRAGERWGYYRGVRRARAGGEVLALVEGYVPLRFLPEMEALASTPGPLSAAMEAASGERIVDAIQETQALALPYHAAEALGAPTGGAALRILRRYSTASGTLLASFNWHHGGERYIHRCALSLDGR